MNILDLIQKETGNIYRKKASTLGGEHAGPCGFCGGVDRMSIHPARGRFVCRRCHSAGDSIAFIQKYHNKTYIEACNHLNIQPSFNQHYKSLNTATEKPGQNEIKWEPREIILPSTTWQNKAEVFLFEKFKFLMSGNAKQYRKWLNNRGINNQTIKKSRMGYNTRSVSFDSESWGLIPENNQNAKKQAKNESQVNIWLPVGLIIPQFYNEKLIRLRIRQENPISDNRFIVVRGSASGYFDYDAHLSNNQVDNRPVLTTESELDGWLLHQKANDKFKIYAIGSVSARPDIETHNYIKDKPGLLNLDNDEAGQNEQGWWKKQYPKIKTHYSEIEKDPGDDFKAGLDIRKWLIAGLEKLDIVVDPETKIQSDLSLPTDFKQKLIDKHKNRNEHKNEKIEIDQEPVVKPVIKPTKKYRQTCLHDKPCQYLHENICSLIHQDPIENMVCPKELWYEYKENDIISEIILGVGVKK